MNYELLIISAILSSSGDDIPWQQLLVFIVLAVIWAIGGIIKAGAKKLESKQQAQPPRREPPQPSGQQIAPSRRLPSRPSQQQPRTQIQPPRRKVMRPETAVRKLAAKTAQAVYLESIEELKSSIPSLQVQPDFNELPEFTGKAVEKLKDKFVSAPAEISKPQYLAELSLDYADPDKLRRAILHYEILGKPLSLRSPSEHIIGL